MPGAADLPESIRDFAYINAAPIDIGRDFRQHMERLTRSIDGIVGTDKAAMEVVLARGYPDAPKTPWSARRLAAVSARSPSCSAARSSRSICHPSGWRRSRWRNSRNRRVQQ